MRLILIRHGEAIEKGSASSDAARWLTGKGRKATRRLGTWLADKRKRRPAAIWTSSAVRAVQTAEILAERCKVSDVRVHDELAPGAPVEPVVRALAGYDGQGPLAVVGHDPALSDLARRLLGNDELPDIRKSGVVILSWSSAGGGELERLRGPKSARANGGLPAPSAR